MQDTRINILNELSKALERHEMDNKTLASFMDVSPSTISNWWSRGEIPAANLIKAAKTLQDTRFKLAAAQYIFGIPLIFDRPTANSPYAYYFRFVKEENDRRRLDDDFTSLNEKPSVDRTAEDVREIRQFLKEFHEEVLAEVAFLLATSNNWDISLDELNKVKSVR